MWGFVALCIAVASAGLQQGAASTVARDPYAGMPDLAPDGEGNEAGDGSLLPRHQDVNGDAATVDAVHEKPVDPQIKWRPRIIVQEQLAPASVSDHDKVAGNHSLKGRPGPVVNGSNARGVGASVPLDGVATPAEGRPGKIVLLSAAQFLNGSGQYQVAGSERVRKSPGFEIAYDYYFKPEQPRKLRSFKTIAKRSVPLILASSFLTILVICVAVCIAGICWRKTHGMVTSRPPATTTIRATTMANVSRRNAAGDADAAMYTNDKYVV